MEAEHDLVGGRRVCPPHPCLLLLIVLLVVVGERGDGEESRLMSRWREVVAGAQCESCCTDQNPFEFRH